MSDIKNNANKILNLIEEAATYQNPKEKLLSTLKTLEDEQKAGKITSFEYQRLLIKTLKGKTKEEWLNYYNHYLKEILHSIIELSTKIEEEATPSLKPSISKSISSTTNNKKKEKLEVKVDLIKKYAKAKKAKKEEKKIIDKPYEIYEANPYGQFASIFTKPLVNYFIKKYPEMFTSLFHNLKLSDMKILSRSYVAIIFFSSVASFTLVTLGMALLLPTPDPVSTLIRSLILGVMVGVAVFAGLYLYPSSIVNSRKKKIKNDLPFVTLQMSAIAGSGANPTSIFDLLLTTEDYKGLASEIKKIVNYINLFGYDLNTALRSVSTTTPSPEFRELLTGIVSTTEAGGDLKVYLKDKAEEALTTYDLERKKYVQTIATYSDIYTAILIVAPLLFITVLAIIQVIGGNIGGFSVKTLALGGTFVGVPLVNIAFLIFLSMTQPT